MKPFVTVLRREIAEHRMFLAAGVLVGLMPLALPLLPGTEGSLPSELRAGAAAVLAVLLGVTVAFILGTSALTRDLAERRLGFYFSRPISGLSIWGGKMSAAAIVTVGTSLLVLLPAFLLGDLAVPLSPPVQSGMFDGNERLELVLTGAVLLLLLMLLSHAVSTALRSRTPWLLLDVAALTVIASLALFGWNQLSAAGALYISPPLILMLLLALAAGLIAGSLVQVLRGRTDLHAGHRWLSWTLWVVLGLSTLGLTGLVQWALSAEPEDLAGLGAHEISGAGSWIFVEGPAPHRLGYQPAFLYDTASGRYVRTHLQWYGSWLGKPRIFSENGAWAAWIESRSARGPQSLVRVDLRGSQPRVYRDPVTFWPDTRLALSPDGSRLALYSYNKIQVQETETGKLLASVAGWEQVGEIEHFFFADNRHLRYIGRNKLGGGSSDPANLRVTELDLATGKLSSPVVIPGSRLWSSILSPRRDLLLARDFQLDQYRLFDLKDGRELGMMPFTAASLTQEDTYFLPDGRLLLTRSGSGRCELRIFAAGTMREIRRYSWTGFDKLALGGQPIPGHLAIRLIEYSTRRPSPPFELSARRTRPILVNLETGATRDLPPALIPLVGPGEPSTHPGSRLFFHRKQGIVKLDPVTGRETPVLTFG